MKTLLLIAIIVIAFGRCGMAQSVSNVSTFAIAQADTMIIIVDNNVGAFVVQVPESATDSCVITGNNKTISGIASSSIKVAPGYSFSFGQGSLPINWVRIIVKNKANIAVYTLGRH